MQENRLEIRIREAGLLEQAGNIQGVQELFFGGDQGMAEKGIKCLKSGGSL